MKQFCNLGRGAGQEAVGCRWKQYSIPTLPGSSCLQCGASSPHSTFRPSSDFSRNFDAQVLLRQLKPSSFLMQIAMGIPLHRIKDIRVLYGESPWGETPICFCSPTNAPVPRGHVIAARITSENPEEVSQQDRLSCTGPAHGDPATRGVALGTVLPTVGHCGY